MSRKPVLGKGLKALIPESSNPALMSEQTEPTGTSAEGSMWVRSIPVERISPNPHQPRRNFDETELNELADSIKVHGMLQPILVTLRGDGYELVSGERRLRASQIAGLKTVPAILVNPEDPVGSLTIALVENVQRADLGAIELANAYRELKDDFGRKQEEIAATVGKSRSHVANTLRLLELSEPMRDAIAKGAITPGHARALLVVEEPDRQRLFTKMIKNGISVRAAENEAKVLADPDKKRGVGRVDVISEIDDKSIKLILSEMEKAVESALGRKCIIRRSMSGKGTVLLDFYSDRDLESLVEKIRSR